MRRFLRPFRRLRWKLTASYTLVTVAALLSLELLVVGIVIGLLRDQFQDIPRNMAQKMSEQVAPRLAPLLKTEPPDLESRSSTLTSGQP